MCVKSENDQRYTRDVVKVEHELDSRHANNRDDEQYASRVLYTVLRDLIYCNTLISFENRVNNARIVENNIYYVQSPCSEAIGLILITL